MQKMNERFVTETKFDYKLDELKTKVDDNKDS